LHTHAHHPTGQRHAHGPFAPHERREHRHRSSHGRLFDHGELRLVILSLIAEKPRHGYEIIKAIEERLGGAYSPSPGVVYPTLTLLEELGHIEVAQAGEGGRKLSSVSLAGQAWLTENAATLESVNERMRRASGSAANQPPAAILRAMENLKMALRLKLQTATPSPELVAQIAAALDAAAVHVENA